MAAATDQDRFEAAVKIITGMPKDGPFQPSNDMKLKFYGLFKQATLGPCTSSQPAFWDVVNRAKWGSWKSLGEMPKDEAMRNYVEILKQVVETMTLDSNVQDFLEKIGPMYEFVTDDGRVVSKRADIRPEHESALDLLDLARGRHELINGGHSAEKIKAVNGKLPNGKSSMPEISSDDSEEDGERIKNQNGHIEKVPSIIRKVDLEAASDEEEFDDASDNQAFASVTVDIAPIQSSGSHSPLSSYDSTPPRLSKAVQSIDETKSLEGDNKMLNSGHHRHHLNPLSPTRRRAATALGQLLRQLPEVDVNQSRGNTSTTDGAVVATTNQQSAVNFGNEDSIIKAWSVLRRIHEEQSRRAWNDDDWLLRRLKRLKRGSKSGGHRKHRGRGGGNNDKQGEGGTAGNGNESTDGGENGAAEAPQQPNDAGGSLANRRSQRQLSGESGSSSSSSGADSANLDFDPHVGAVLLRMHRELQHINRQLELVENILITQQQMIRNVIAESNKQQEKKMRLGFFSNLPWRTIAFIVAWPVVVNFLVRLYIFKIRRRR